MCATWKLQRILRDASESKVSCLSRENYLTETKTQAQADYTLTHTHTLAARRVALIAMHGCKAHAPKKFQRKMRIQENTNFLMKMLQASGKCC